MAYGSVNIPAGCTVKIGDTVGTLTDIGVLKGDASIQIAYDLQKVLGSKAETLIDYIKNPRATATFEMYQIYWPNIQKLLDGALTHTPIAAAALTHQGELIPYGEWEYDRFYPLANQMGSGLVPTINRVAGSLDTTLELTMAAALAGDTVTINGITFTAAVATNIPLRQFDISGLDAADATALALVINDPTYGVPGITATPLAAVVTLSVDDPLVTGLWADSSDPLTIAIAGVDEYVLGTDYFLLMGHDGRWGINLVAGGLVSTENQVVTVDSDYTPNAANQLDMGDKTATLVSKIVEFSKIISGKTFRARLWSVTNEEGLAIAFPDSANDEPMSLPVTLVGALDTDRVAGTQLIEIYDEIGLVFP